MKKKQEFFGGASKFFPRSGGMLGKLVRPRCRPQWDTHLKSKSLLNWNSQLEVMLVWSLKIRKICQVKTMYGFPIQEVTKCGMKFYTVRAAKIQHSALMKILNHKWKQIQIHAKLLRASLSEVQRSIPGLVKSETLVNGSPPPRHFFGAVFSRS